MGGAPTTRTSDQRLSRRPLGHEVALSLAGFAVVWFALISAIAYVAGPTQLCHVAFAANVCELVAPGL